MACTAHFSQNIAPHTLANVELAVMRVLNAAKGDYPSVDEPTYKALVRYILLASGINAPSLLNRIHYDAGNLNKEDTFNELQLDVPRTCTSDEIPVPIANACLMRCITEKIGVPRQITLDGDIFSDEMDKSFDLYEKAFGKLTNYQFKKLVKHASNKNTGTGYPILQHPPTRDGYVACRAAARAHTNQHKIALSIASGGKTDDRIIYIGGDPLWDELDQMSAQDAIRLLTNGGADIADGWKEDEISYLLADMLLDALHEIYDDILEKENEEKHNIEPTREWVSHMCDEHFVSIKLECFLEGVPMRDVLA